MKWSHLVDSVTFKSSVVVLACACFYAPLASAEVYRCTNSAGKTEFSDAPCPRGSASKSLDIRPNVVDTSDFREQSLKAENQELRNQLATRQTDAANSGKANTNDASRIDSAACRTAKRDLEITASSIDKNPAMFRAREAAMYGACGLREPDRTNITIKNEKSRDPVYLVPKAPRTLPH